MWFIPSFTENYDLLTIFHKPLWILMHTVNKHLIIEIALHFGDIYDATVCQFLEFGIVDICTVKCHNLVVAVMARSEHERVIGRRRSEPHVARERLRWRV